MSVYFDTGVLAKLYSRESNSPEAIALVRDCKAPIVLTHLQELELRTAVRLKVFRQESTQEAAAFALASFDLDIERGFYQPMHRNLTEIYRQAKILSAAHTAAIGCRTLDILHVATAAVIDTTEFISFDRRQRALAKEAGLRIKPTHL